MEQRIQYWRDNLPSGQLKDQLEDLIANDNETLTDAFFRILEFGTAGLRGLLGVGSNCMNVYTVAQATQGFANYLNCNYDAPKIVIARDSRNFGPEFVKTSASVMAANGIKVYMFDAVAPTPTLSYAIRKLGAKGGINITASHNPAEYNGYKVYDDSGCQITTEAANAISTEIARIDIFSGPKYCNVDQAINEGKIEILGEDMYLEFCDAVLNNGLQGFFEEISSIDLGNKDLSVVYTPLNGAGLFCAKEIFSRLKLNNVELVKSQLEPDGNFPTCPYPNPEMEEALCEGLKLARKKNADILVATDPDADRMGVAIKEDGDYRILSGNEIGMLMLDYLITMHKKLGNKITKKMVDISLVSSPIIEDMARSIGFELRLTLTGFKFIGEQVNKLVEDNRESDFLFGYEESYGYCSGTHVRDKDALNAIALFISLARTLKANGISVSEQLDKIYRKYGYYAINIVSYSYPGAKGAARMREIMNNLQSHPLTEIAGLKVVNFKNYNKPVEMTIINPSCEPQTLPNSNVLEFQLEGGNKVIVRPSGTEPKIKSYFFAKKSSRKEAEAFCDELNNFISKIMN